MDAPRTFEQAACVREMCSLLQRFLNGEVTRDEIVIWCHSIWPPTSGQGGPFRKHGTASSVFDSIWNIDKTTSPGEYVVRGVDVCAYVRWLQEGDSFLGEEEPLAAFESGWEDIALLGKTQRARFWLDGIGWIEELRLVANHNGRAFAAVASTSADKQSMLTVHMRRGDDWTLALRDLFEELAVDDEDTMAIATGARIDDLQRWSVWRLDDNGQSFEMTTCKSYAKAMRIQLEKENLGHKQTYWVAKTTSRAD